ncbi:MAG: 4Fe-4S binding protein [Deltaproteobacteria bacterium]|nr:4Fe-4S binding protein [Deltaproteobacteria bacterium]
MKELVVISGKGGTGKTTILAAFAFLAKNKVLCDADVDAADLHLIMDPQIRERHDFDSGHTAVINQDKCTQCGYCRDLCRWNAISEHFVVDPIACEGCGVCHYFCPEEAIDFPLNTCGEWFISDTRFGPMAHARLGIAEENSGKLVTLIRQQGKKLAEEKNLDLLLTDGPPGIGCPVIASMGGATAVLIVAEPTVSGRHDMKRVAELAAFFKVPAMVCVNKFDINPDEARDIEDFAREEKMRVMGRIPFDPVFTSAMVQGKTIFEYDGHSGGARAVKKIWEDLVQSL